MKILWITNIVFPEAEKILTGNGGLKSSGGWMLGAAESLLQMPDIELAVATPTNLVHNLSFITGERIKYYLFPLGKGNVKYNKEYEKYWINIKEEFMPDIVHIHGTEFSHGLAYVNACGAEHVVVSIQGLVSAYYYYYYGLSKWDILKNITLRDLIRGSIFQGKRSFRKRGELERILLKKVSHVIGRTKWDEARVWEINPDVHYHFCNETLRPEFYDDSKWKYEQCKKHSIFMSQAGYPIKGLHQLLKAMPLIMREYPDTVIRIAGFDITKKRYFYKVIPFMTGYGKLIYNMIKSLNLENHVEFIGGLDSVEMKREYLRCNLFVCPSTIENSPNSLGEAQILGTPVVASYVGGIPDMMKGDEEHLFRFEEVSMLAKTICNVFKCKGALKDMQLIARRRHDRVVNQNALINIYCIIKEMG